MACENDVPSLGKSENQEEAYFDHRQWRTPFEGKEAMITRTTTACHFAAFLESTAEFSRQTPAS